MKLFGNNNPLINLPYGVMAFSALILRAAAQTSAPASNASQDGTRNDAANFVVWGSAAVLTVGGFVYCCCKASKEDADDYVDRRTEERRIEDMEAGIMVPTLFT